MSILLPCGVTLTAEVAFGATVGAYGAYGLATYDTSTYGPDAIYQDVSSYLRFPLRTDRKFSRDVRAWDSGSASMVLSNRDRRFSPDNLSGPYVVGGLTGIRPWRPARLRATYANTTYDLYAGYAVAYQGAWAGGHADATVAVSCADEMARLAKFDGLEQAPVGAGEATGVRIHRILTNTGYTGARNIAVGRNTVQATTLASNAVTELKLVADSEGGGLFVDADGSIVFEDQYALIEQTRSNTIQATFGDGSGSELECSDVATDDYNGDTVVNIVSYARAGGTAQTVTDETSRALDGGQRATRTDLLCETDDQVLILATFDLARFKDPEQRIVQIKIRPQADPARLWPQVLGRRVRDLIRVVVRPIGGATVTRDCHIAGIHHDTDGASWTTTFDLTSATVFRAFASSRYDVATYDSSPYFF